MARLRLAAIAAAITLIFASPARAASIQIETGAASHLLWTLQRETNIASFASGSSSFDLAAGNYSLVATYSGHKVSFAVDAAGQVSYDAALEGVLTGAGTSTLTVGGRSLHIDATALSDYDLGVAVTGSWRPADAVRHLQLLPGAYTVANVWNGNSVSFTLQQDGTITYDSGIDPIVDGAGTNTLTITGTQVSVDSTSLDEMLSQLRHASPTWASSSGVATFNVLPGSHAFITPFTQGSMPFTLAMDGTITYDPMYEGIADGSGTGLLTMEGVQITVDGSYLGTPNLLGLRTIVADFSGDGIDAVRVMPGTHLMHPNIHQQQHSFNFDVSLGGLISFDPALGPFVQGQGTTTLTLGAPAVAVPEPGPLALGLLSAAGLVTRARKRTGLTA